MCIKVAQSEEIKDPTEWKNTFVSLGKSLDIVGGKWKLKIIHSLINNEFRFNRLHQMIPGISPKMLSKELKDLEISGVVKRNVLTTSFPVIVTYELTPNNELLKSLIDILKKVGDHYSQSKNSQVK